MPKWTDYTKKTTLKDNDEFLLLDTDGKANKRTLASRIWDYVLGKLTSAVIEKLETTDKTAIGAINELQAQNEEITSTVNIVDSSSKQRDKEFTTTDDLVGNSFGKNFLYIHTDTKNSDLNRNSYWSSDNVRTDFVSVPDTMPNKASGTREVFWKDTNSILVKITEASPVSGREYYNHYNGTTWEGWKVVEPSYNGNNAFRVYTASGLGIELTDDLVAIISKLQDYNSELVLWINNDTTYGQKVREELKTTFNAEFYGYLTIRRMVDGKSVQFTAVHFDGLRAYMKMYTTVNGEKWGEWREL